MYFKPIKVDLPPPDFSCRAAQTSIRIKATKIERDNIKEFEFSWYVRKLIRFFKVKFGSLETATITINNEALKSNYDSCFYHFFHQYFLRFFQILKTEGKKSILDQ